MGSNEGTIQNCAAETARLAQLLRRMVIRRKAAQRPQVPGGAHGDPRVLRGGGDGPVPLLLRVQRYAGLFGLSEGTLKDIVYLMDPDETVTVSRSKVNLYLGVSLPSFDNVKVRIW